MKLLTISTLFPNSEDLKHGIFVENRLRHLLQHYPQVEATVVAPVPWFPVKSARFKEYAKFVDVKPYEYRHGIHVYHPKYIVIPKVGMLLTPFFLALSMCLCCLKLFKQQGKPDVIDGHYFYPDGVAIALIAKLFSIPFTCTSRGTDINLISDMPIPRKMIKWVIRQSSRCMGVCQALTDRLTELGAKDAVTLRNGVDLQFFYPLSDEKRSIERNKLLTSIQGRASTRILLSVGWLVERKGHYLIIDALKDLPDTHLFIAGNGPDDNALKQQVHALSLQRRVTFLGSLSQTELRLYYQLADSLVLASSREGWANVLLESMACGTPVIATNIWGTPEVVKTSDAGILCERSSIAIAKASLEQLNALPNRSLTRQYAEQFDWQSTSDGQYLIFSELGKQS